MKRFDQIILPDGRNLAFAEFGDPAGSPIYYCHGGISSKLDIAFVDSFCENNGIRIIAPDRPAIGESDRKEGRTLLDWADDSRCLLENLHIAQTAVLGWSLGGPYALACGYRLPDLVSRVGIIGDAGNFDNPEAVKALGLWIDRLLFTCPEWLQWLLGAGLQLSALLPPEIAKQTLINELSSQSDREVVKALSLEDATAFIYQGVSNGGVGVLDDYNAVGRPWNFSPSEINVEVRIWHGEEDVLCPISVAQEMVGQVQKASLTVVPQAGHFLLHKNLDMVLNYLVGKHSGLPSIAEPGTINN